MLSDQLQEASGSVRKRIERELEKAHAKKSKGVQSMDGYRYSGGGGNLERGRQDKQQFAVTWRERLLALAVAGELEERAVIMSARTAQVKFRVFSIHGKDVYAVAPTKGSNFIYRTIGVEYLKGKRFEDFLRRRGFNASDPKAIAAARKKPRAR